jgi:hypothetical protein
MTATSFFFRKSLSALLVAGALTSAAIASAPSAQAFPIFPHPHHWGHGWGPGWGYGLAGAALGAALVSGAYAAPAYCHWERRFDGYGEYLGRVRVCD